MPIYLTIESEKNADNEEDIKNTVLAKYGERSLFVMKHVHMS